MIFERPATLNEWLDQLLHATWGAALTFVFWINIGIAPSQIVTDSRIY